MPTNYFNSKVSNFTLAGQDISPYITSIDGLPGAAELFEVTGLGAHGRAFVKGLENVLISLELMWSDDASVGPDTVIGPLRAYSQSSASAFVYGPKGTTNGYPKYSGNCWVRDYKITARVGNLITARCDLQVDGVVSRGTF